MADEPSLAEAHATVQHGLALQTFHAQVQAIDGRLDYLDDSQYQRYAELTDAGLSRANINARIAELGALADEASWCSEKVPPRPKARARRIADIQGLLPLVHDRTNPRHEDAVALYKALEPELRRLLQQIEDEKPKPDEQAAFYVKRGMPFWRAEIAARDRKRARLREESE